MSLRRRPGRKKPSPAVAQGHGGGTAAVQDGSSGALSPRPRWTGSGTLVADTSAGGAVRDDRGAEVADVAASFRGILYNTGFFEATGTGSFYGSVIALEGVTQTPSDGSVDTPTIIWDESIVGDWPPEGWDLPRVVITEWDTDG